jgi:uncharacterized membrane protein YvlD (DUF360 family)
VGAKLAIVLRLSGALLVLAAGVVHLWLYFDFFHGVHVIGVLFLLNAASAAIVGLALVLSGRPLVAAAGIAYAAGTLGAFFLSVYHSLFGYTERLSGGWQEAAGSLELAAICVLLPLLVAGSRRLRLRPLRA